MALANKEFGVEEDRTSGLGPAERKEHYLTAAPFHRFDVNMATWQDYDTMHCSVVRFTSLLRWNQGYWCCCCFTWFFYSLFHSTLLASHHPIVTLSH
jgi:hypothetical protein